MRIFAYKVVPFLLVLMLAAPGWAYASAGKVVYAFGQVKAVDASGGSRILRRGAAINAGDTLKTGRRGRAQIRFSDGGFVSLRPGTSFRVDEFHYEGREDGSEKGFFSLLKGGLRAITGRIGKKNRQAYRVHTPVATIGIRGTSFALNFGDDGKLYLKVGDGAIYVFNDAGTLELVAGQSAVVPDQDSAPEQTIEPPRMDAVVPAAVEEEPVIAQGEQESGEDVATAGQIIGPLTGVVTATDSLTSTGFFPDVFAFTDVFAATGSPPVAAVGQEFEPETGGFLPIFGSVVDARSEIFYQDDTILLFRWSMGSVLLDDADAPDGFSIETFADEQAIDLAFGMPTTADLAQLGGVVHYHLIPGASSPTAVSSGTGLSGPGATSINPGGFDTSKFDLFLSFGDAPQGAIAEVQNFDLFVDHNNAIYHIQGGGPVARVVGPQGTPLVGFGQGFLGGSFSAQNVTGSGGNCLSGCFADVAGTFNGDTVIDGAVVPSHALVGYAVDEAVDFSGVAGFEATPADSFVYGNNGTVGAP